MIKYFDCWDEAQGRQTVLLKNSFGWEILGADGQLYPIDPCWATYYRIIYERKTT
jgi:hypothetical protein